MLIENLEDRRLFAVTVDSSGGTLTITGDDGANLIDVRLSADGTNYVVRTATATDASSTTSTTPTTNSLRPLATDGSGDGSTSTTTTTCPGRVSFGDITTTEVAVADVTNGITVNAGGGDDRVSIGRGVTADATIDGGDGNDDLSGGNGNDTIDGGAGDDHIRGGAGADTLKGGAGDDTINARDGEVDTVDGGSDTNGDIGVVDSTSQTTGNTTPDTVSDTVTNVEASRASGGAFGFGGFFGHGGFFFGGGGFGHHGFGRHHGGDDDGDGGSTDSGGGSTTTNATPASLSLFRFARGGFR